MFDNCVVGSPAFATVELKVGVVPTIAAFGVTGTLNVLVAVAPVVVKDVGVVQVTTELDVLQVQPFDVNVGVVVIPKGKVIVAVVVPVVAAVPIFEIVTGILLGTPTANGAIGCPIADVKSGAVMPTTGVVGVIGVAGLFGVALVGSFGTTGVAVNGPGAVPTVLVAGVTGIFNTAVLFGAVLLIGPGVEHVTVCPLVVHVEPFVVNVAGALVPAGKPIVVTIGPVAGPVPWFVNVTGTVLGVPATNGVNGCPIVVTTSGVPATGVVGVIGVAGLFGVALVGSFGTTGVAVNGPGAVPTVLVAGVTGIFNTAVFVGAVLLIGPGVEQVTVCPLVVQVEPFVVNDAGALVPVGKPIVVTIGPVAGPVP